MDFDSKFFEGILEEIKQHYVNVLSEFYPTVGNRGFTEENLTVAFGNAFAKGCPGAVIWYELPFVKESTDRFHVDLAILIPKERHLVLVESKRFSGSGKVKECTDNLKRISDPGNIKAVLDKYSEEHNKGLVDKYDKVTACILADVWTESKFKTEVYDQWRDKKFFDNNERGIHVDGEYYIEDFNDINRLGENTKKNYHMLMFTHEYTL